MGLNAIDAARRAVSPIAVIATLPETVPELRSITRRAGMTGWEGELVRRAGDVSLDRAGTVLPWWPGHVVRRVLATGRSRLSSHSFVSEYEAMSVGVAERVLGRFAHVEALAADLEWLVDHCDPRSRPQLSDALRRPRPTSPAARSHVLALALHRFREDCLLRGAERAGVTDALGVMLLRHLVDPRSDDPRLYGWSERDVAAAAETLPSDGDAEGLWRAVETEADALAADPWESMTESRRTRALGVIEAAADTAVALPGASPLSQASETNSRRSSLQ